MGKVGSEFVQSCGPFLGPLVCLGKKGGCDRGGGSPGTAEALVHPVNTHTPGAGGSGDQASPGFSRCPWLGATWAACLGATYVNLGPVPFSENSSEGN